MNQLGVLTHLQRTRIPPVIRHRPHLDIVMLLIILVLLLYLLLLANIQLTETTDSLPPEEKKLTSDTSGEIQTTFEHG